LDVFICCRDYLLVGCVLYVFVESWIGVGLDVRWVVCTVNCGGTHCYTVLMLILRVTVYYHVMPIVVHAVIIARKDCPLTQVRRDRPNVCCCHLPGVFSTRRESPYPSVRVLSDDRVFMRDRTVDENEGPRQAVPGSGKGTQSPSSVSASMVMV